MKKIDIGMLLLAFVFTIGFLFLSREMDSLEKNLAKKTKEAADWKKKYEHVDSLCHHIDSTCKVRKSYNAVWYKPDPMYMGNDD